MPAAHAEPRPRLVSLLKPSEPRDFLNAILACMSANTGVLPLKQAQDALDHFLISTDSEVRGRAIELLGEIGEVDVIDVRRSRRAAKALLITTSGFTKEALALAAQHSPDIRLINGDELLGHLDEFFGKDRYTIKSRG